jgi:hypothetical protein
MSLIFCEPNVAMAIVVWGGELPGLLRALQQWPCR